MRHREGPRLSFFDGKEQQLAFVFRILIGLGSLGFGHFQSVNIDDGVPALVGAQHDRRGFGFILLEEATQDFHHELTWSEGIVVHDDGVHRRMLRLLFRFCFGRGCNRFR